jgi:Rieske Fe-S protein
MYNGYTSDRGRRSKGFCLQRSVIEHNQEGLSRRKLHPTPLRNDADNLSRRTFLRVGSYSGVIVSLLGITGMVQNFLARGRSSEKPLHLRIGPRADFLQINVMEKEGIYLVREEKSLLAFTGECSHLGCRIRWKPKENVFECPCHGSRFDRLGRYLSGPAKKPLQQVFLAIDDRGEITADLTRKRPAGTRLMIG